MAYFLKKTTLKNRTYLAIYDSFYSHDKKAAAHKCYKSLGSVETLKKNGLDDPVAFYQKEVDDLNHKRKLEGVRKISDVSPILYLPYSVDYNGKKKTVMLTEKRLVTYNPSLTVKKRYEINRVVEKAKELTLLQAKRSDFGEAGKYVNFREKMEKRQRQALTMKQ